jgi:hypothetical protein
MVNLDQIFQGAPGKTFDHPYQFIVLISIEPVDVEGSIVLAEFGISYDHISAYDEIFLRILFYLQCDVLTGIYPFRCAGRRDKENGK